MNLYVAAFVLAGLVLNVQAACDVSTLTTCTVNGAQAQGDAGSDCGQLKSAFETYEECFKDCTADDDTVKALRDAFNEAKTKTLDQYGCKNSGTQFGLSVITALFISLYYFLI